ncbi:MAG: YtxH domain-containing protein [Alistipes sp.]|nr:YtxH domain-containing protein [Alistipes sp.]MBO7307662.1 YtxH domain-containing protein [Alistipes sp.]
MKHSSLCLLSALGGALVGAMVAVLVTPTSGKELRHKIRDAMSEAEARMRADFGCKCENEAK